MKNWLFVCFALLSQPLMIAQQPRDTVISLDEVILELEPAKVSPLGPVPSEVLTENAIRVQNPVDFAGTLNQVPGIYFLSGALNTNRITIRGVGARTPFGTNKLKMYFNDIPVTNGTGFSTLEAYDLENLNRIRVVKGPKSEAYGAALGGALLLRTDPRTQEGTSLRNRTVFGSYGLFKTNLSLAHRDSTLSAELRYNRLYTDGYRENNTFDRDGLLLNLGYQAGERHKLNLLVNFIDYTAQIPSSLGRTDYETDPTQAAFTWGQAKGFEANKYTLVGVSDQIELGENLENTTSLFATYLDHYEPRPFNILDEYTFGYGFRSVFRGTFNMGDNQARAELGGELYKDQYNWSTYENLYESNNGQGSLQGDLISRNREFRKQLNIFGSLEFIIRPFLSLRAGLALNQTKYDFRDLLEEGEQNRSAVRDFEPILLPNLNLRYETQDGDFAYFNISRGFSNPSLEESLNPDGLINPEISQEKGMNYELGGRWFVLQQKMQLSAALYQMNIEDLLVAERVGDDQFIGRNAGKTRHRGFELSMEYRLTTSSGLRFIPFLSYTLNDHVFVEFTDADSDYSGNPLTGVPRNRVYGGLRIQGRTGWYFNGTYQYVDPIPLTDGNTLQSDPYQLLNFQCGYRFALFEGLRAGLEFGVNNLLNTRYASSVLINANSFGGAEPRYYYPGNDRNYYSGLLLLYSF
jgi:iron complex outermembrane receptor protein